MGLSKEEKAQLDALTKKANEPDTPPPNVSYTLDLGNDSAFERAKKLGLIPSDDGGNDDDDDDSEEELADVPKRRGRGDKYFGGNS